MPPRSHRMRLPHSRDLSDSERVTHSRHHSTKLNKKSPLPFRSRTIMIPTRLLSLCPRREMDNHLKGGLELTLKKYRGWRKKYKFKYNKNKKMNPSNRSFR